MVSINLTSYMVKESYNFPIKITMKAIGTKVNQMGSVLNT